MAAMSRASERRVRVDAEALELALLQDAQQLRLQFERDLANLIEEDGALVGELEAADALRDGAGEGAALVPEKFAFEQTGGNRRAVELDERARVARAEIVEGAGDQLLARAGLAVDDDGGIGGSDRLHFAQDAAQGFALADDLFEIPFAADFVLEIQLLARQLVLEIGDLAEGHGIFDGHSYLAGDLSQERQIGWGEDVLAEAAQATGRQRSGCAR